MKDPESGAVARQVLATVLDNSLRLFHPFIPFITEAIWELLNERAPQRGIETALPQAGLAMLASWPAPHPDWEDDALEDEFRLMQEVVRRIRDIRNKYTVPLNKEIDALVKAAGKDAETLRHMTYHIKLSSKLATLTVDAAAEKPELAAVQVLGDMEIYVDGVLDVETELARLDSQRENLLKRIEGAQKKLSNENFVSRAPADIVAKERERLAELENQLALVDENIAQLRA